MTDLNVFDLQRFAMHDGPGIRTTVFLKGCPLDCIWCHNPESKKIQPQLGFLEKNCIDCGRCGAVCPKGVHQIQAHVRHKVDFAKCVHCGRCIEVCPNHALKIFGRVMRPEKLMETVVRDQDFYRRSGGGLTVSGGEPMLQFSGLLELLKMAKERNIHVCLDTSGYASTEKYKVIAPYVDLFLFDYKITDPEEHRKYVGADNRLILKNLDLLCRLGSDVFLRCPIIPKINDNERHYRAIAGLSRKYPQIREVNLMIYHDMARGKAAQIGEKYALADIGMPDADERKKIYEAVKRYGCLRLGEN